MRKEKRLALERIVLEREGRVREQLYEKRNLHRKSSVFFTHITSGVWRKASLILSLYPFAIPPFIAAKSKRTHWDGRDFVVHIHNCCLTETDNKNEHGTGTYPTYVYVCGK